MTVSIQGEGFAPDLEVRLGATASPQVRFVDTRTVLAEVPSGPPGMVDLTVRSRGQTITVPSAFRYDDDGHDRCRLLSITPAVGATDVRVVSDIRLTFSQRLGAAPAPADVHVRELGHDEIAVRTRLGDDRKTVIITPEHSLHFWASYLVQVPGPISRRGKTCDAATGVFSTVVPSVADRPLRPASINALARVGDSDVVLASVGGYRGFQILKLDAESGLTLLGDLVTPVAPLDLLVVGARAFAAAGFDGVMVLDVSQPEAPQLVTRFGTPGVAQALASFEAGGRQYLAVGDGLEGARIFDVTATLAPFPVAVLAARPEGSQVGSLLMMNGHLVAASYPNPTDEASAFVVYDVADPTRPVKLSESPEPRGVSSLASSGAILYVGLGYYGIDAFDMTDPAAPRFLNHVDGPSDQCGFPCHPALRMRVDDGRLWVAMARTGAASYSIDGAGGMVLHNVVPVSGNTQALLPLGTRLLVGAEEGALLYDADAGPGASPLAFDPRGHGVAGSVAVSDDGFAYVAAAVRGVQTFAITDAAGQPIDQPSYLGQTPTPSAIGPFNSRTGNVLLDGQRILVGDARAGLAVLDRHDPRNPVLVGSLRALDQVSALQLRGDLVFGCDDNTGLAVYDVSVSSAPAEVARATFIADPHESCRDLLLSGDVLFMAGGRHLAAVDVSDPLHPSVRAEVTTPEQAILWSVAAIDATHLLALTSDMDFEGQRFFISRLQLFDVSDPLAPRWVWSSEDLGGTGFADALAVRGDVAFVAARDAGVWIFDVSRPDAPLAEGLVAMPGLPRGLTPSADRVFVAEQEGGLGVIRTGTLPEAR